MNVVDSPGWIEYLGGRFNAKFFFADCENPIRRVTLLQARLRRWHETDSADTACFGTV
jgi:hypothetical protein